MEEAEVHNVVATLAATGKHPTLAADGLFGMEEWPAAGPCAPGKPKPVPDAPWTTLLSLYAGSAETVNAGARWQLPNGRQAAMATVVDWRIEVDAFSDLHATWEGRNAARMRSVWPGLKDTVQPDGAGQPTIDLWMLHLPHRLEALEISSKPASNHHVNGDHFRGYHALMSCPAPGRPEAPELLEDLGDPRAPHGTQSNRGMLIDCMVAKAPPA